MKVSVRIFFNSLLFLLLKRAGSTIVTTHSTSPSERNGRASLFSFHPLGDDVAVGLDFEVPFVQVPMKQYKGKFGNHQAMVNINTASLITSGLLAGSSLIVAHLIRSLNLFQVRSVDGELDQMEEDGDSEKGEKKMFREGFTETESREKRIAGAEDYLYDSKSLSDHFKFVYKNDTGERIETTLPSLLAHIAETFSDKEVDIGACVQKSTCLMLLKSSKKVHQGQATGLEKIIDGVSSLTWLLDALMPYEELRTAIKTGKTETGTSCMLAYPSCRWTVPEMRLAELIRTYVNFV